MPTIETAHKWLNKFNPSYLLPHSSLILTQMREKLAINDKGGVIFLMDRVCALCTRKQKAEAEVECASIMHDLGDFTKAVELLESARRGYIGDRHQTAVVLAMRGYVLWKIPTRHEDAIRDWVGSLKQFELILKISSNNQKQLEWYDSVILEIKRNLDMAILDDGVEFLDNP